MIKNLYNYLCFKSEHRWTPKQIDETDIFFLMDLMNQQESNAKIEQTNQPVFLDQIIF